VSLKDAGFRFVLRETHWLWVHSAELTPSDKDCTDMDDAQFEAFVLSVAIASGL